MFSKQHSSWQPASRKRVSTAEVAHLLNLYEFLAGQRGVEVPEKLRRKVAQANERTDDQHRLPKLSLKKGKIGDDQVKVLALALWECPIVGVLDLRHNQITHHGVSALMELVRHQMALAKAAALEADAHASGTVASATGTRLVCLFNILVEGNPVMQSSVLLEELSVQLQCAACVSARLGLWFSFADNSGGLKGYLTRSEAQSAVYDVMGLSMKHWRDAEEAFGRHVAEKDRISLPEFITSMLEVLVKKHQVPDVDPPKIVDLLIKAQQSPDDKPSFDHFAALPTPSSVQSMRLGAGALPSPALSTRSSRRESSFFNIVQQARGGSPAKSTAVTPGTKRGQFLKAMLSLRSEDASRTPVDGSGLDAGTDAATHGGQAHGGVELQVPGTPLPHLPQHLTFGSTAAGGGRLVPPGTEAWTPPLGQLVVATHTDSKDGEVVGSVQAPPSIDVSVVVDGEQKTPTAQSPTNSKSKVRLSAIAKRLEVQAKQQADSISPPSGQRPHASSRSRALSNVSSRAGSPSRRSSRSLSPAPTRSPSVRAGSVTSEDAGLSPKPRSSSVFSDGEGSEVVVHHDRPRQVGGRAAASRRRPSRAGMAGAGAAAAMMADDATEEPKPRTLSPAAEQLSPGELRVQTSKEGERRRSSMLAREVAGEEPEQLVTDTSAGAERVESLIDTPDLPGGDTEHTRPMPSAALLPLPPEALPPHPSMQSEAGVEVPEAPVLDKPPSPIEADTPSVHGPGDRLPSVSSEEIERDGNATLSPGPVSYEQRLQTAESFVPVARQKSAEQQQQQLIPGEEEEGEGKREQGQSAARQASVAPLLEPQTSTEASAASRLQHDDSQDSGGNIVSHNGDDEIQFADVDGRGQVDDETAEPFEECATSRDSEHDSLEEHRPLEPFRPTGVSVYTTCCTVKITERDVYDDAEDGAWVITEERLAVQGCGVTHIDLAPTIDGHNLSETLLSLSLASNQLACIDAEALAFSSMPNLTSLNLSHNLIKKMVCLNGEYPSKLRSLDLSDNLIRVISGLQSCVRLSKLNLATNRLTYVDGLCLLDSLQELDISDNRIKKAIGLRGLAFSASLRVLTVRGNHIASKANGHTAIRAFAPKVEFLDGKDIRRRSLASSKAQKPPQPQQRPVAHMTRTQQVLADKARSAITNEKFKALQRERERLLGSLLGKPSPSVSADHQRRQIKTLSVPKKKGRGMRRDFYMAFGRHTDKYNNPPPPPTYLQNSAAHGRASTLAQKLLAAQHKAEEAAKHAYVPKSVPRAVVMTVAQKLLAAQHKAEEEASQRPDQEAALKPLDAHARPPTLAEKLIAAGRRMQQELASRRRMGSPTPDVGNSRDNAPPSMDAQGYLSGCAVDVVVKVRVDDWVQDLEQSIGTTRSVLAQALEEQSEGGSADSAPMRRLQRLCKEVKVLADPTVPVAVQQLIDSGIVTSDYRPLQHGLDLLGQDAEIRNDLRELLKMVTTPPEGAETLRGNCDRLRLKYAVSADSRTTRVGSEVPAVTPGRLTSAHDDSVSRSHAPTTQSTQSPLRSAAAAAEGPGGDGSPHDLSSLSVSAASDAQQRACTAEHVGPGTAAVQLSTAVPVSASVSSQERRSEGGGGYSGRHSSPRAGEAKGNPRSIDLASQSGHSSVNNVASPEVLAAEGLSPASIHSVHDSRSPRHVSPRSSSLSRSASPSPTAAATGSFMPRSTRTPKSKSPRHSSPQEGLTSPTSSAKNIKRRQPKSSSPLPDGAVQLYSSGAAGDGGVQPSVSPTPSLSSQGRARQDTAAWSSRPISPTYAPGSATSSQGFAASPRQGLHSPDRSVSGRSTSKRAGETLHAGGEEVLTQDHETAEEYEWIEGYNNDYQHFFYYHEKTGVSQWEKPDAPYLPYDTDAEEENEAEEEGEVEDDGEAVPHKEESELVGELSPRSHLEVLSEGEETDEDSVAKSPQYKSKVSPSERSRSSIGTLDFSDASRPGRIDVMSGQRHESASSSLPSIGRQIASRQSADARVDDNEDARLDNSQQSSGSVTSGQAVRRETAAATSSRKPVKRSFPSFLSLSSRQSHRGPSAAGETPEVRRSGSWTFLTRKNSSSASEQR